MKLYRDETSHCTLNKSRSVSDFYTIVQLKSCKTFLPCQMQKYQIEIYTYSPRTCQKKSILLTQWRNNNKKNSNKSIVTGRQMKLGRKDAPLNWCSRSQFGLIRQTCSCTKSGGRKWCWWATSEESLGVFSCAAITTQTQKIKIKKKKVMPPAQVCHVPD